MADVQVQRFVQSPLPHPTQEAIAAKRQRTHGECSLLYQCFYTFSDISSLNRFAHYCISFLFLWQQKGGVQRVCGFV